MPRGRPPGSKTTKGKKRRKNSFYRPSRQASKSHPHFLAFVGLQNADTDADSMVENGVTGIPVSPSSPNSSFTCHICQKKLSAASTLRDHINGHTREVNYPCPKCGRKFLRTQYLNTHLKVHAREEQRLANQEDLPFKCTGAECKEAFETESQLDTHLTKHKYECAFCSKAATSRRLLNYHLMAHTGEFPEQCKLCKKWYTSPQVLLTHKCRPKAQDQHN